MHRGRPLRNVEVDVCTQAKPHRFRYRQYTNGHGVATIPLSAGRYQVVLRAVVAGRSRSAIVPSVAVAAGKVRSLKRSF